MVVQPAAGLAVLLLQQQLGRRRAAPRPLQLEVLLRHHRHLDLGLARHRGRAPLRPTSRARHDRCSADNSPITGSNTLVTSSTNDRAWSETLLRRADEGPGSIRHAERLRSPASHIRPVHRASPRRWSAAGNARRLATPPSAGGGWSSWIADGSVDRATFVSDTLDDRMIRETRHLEGPPFDVRHPSRPSTAAAAAAAPSFAADVCVHSSTSYPPTASSDT